MKKSIMYVARDSAEAGYGRIYLYPFPPKKDVENGVWKASCGSMLMLSEKEFPEVSWEDDSPTRVDLIPVATAKGEKEIDN